ncbi:MAG: AMP-binding protein [Nitrospiraceae bacterium]|nr:AMP-binding protein [Nitrospira sp.]MCA9456351.1 AMP-binding protein [Nitrospira sp.]MCB9773817.1 AMP-binding protein [Nitrospiraceae bacterium]
MTVHNRQCSYVHRGGDTPLLGATIWSFFEHTVKICPQAEALVSLPQGRRFTYAGFHQEATKLAKGLLALNVGRGDRVGIWSTNNLEWVLLQMATARIGALLVNINPAYPVDEVHHALTRARVQILFLIPSFRTSHYVEMMSDLCPEVTEIEPEKFVSSHFPDLRGMVVYDPVDPEHTKRPEPGFFTWVEIMARGEKVSNEALSARDAELDPDDPINIQFTSGTTGFPKAVLLTHHNILNNGYFTGRTMHFGPEDRLCVPVPFYHCFGMVVANLACITSGAAIVIPADHFDPGAILAAIEKERCTALYGVPTMFIAELEHPEFHRFDLSSLRTGIMAGAPCPPELVRRVMEDMGCQEILIGYGQTEASPITHLTRLGDSFERRVETVGTNLPHQEVKVIDVQTGCVVPTNHQGEVCFRGYHVMRGYYGQADATREAIDEAGWLHSGDLGILDDDGYLRITGRLKDMIIRGGENIYPAEIEAFYFRHPKIAEIAVFGVPDSKMGEEVAAWIKLHEGQQGEPDEFRAYAKGHMAHYKIPRYVWLVDQFPLTVTGKIQKFRMREIASQWLTKGAPS